MAPRCRQDNRRGQAWVETALVLPIVLLVMIGLIEFGRVFAEYFGLAFATEHVAQSAARLGGYTAELDTILDRNSFMIDTSKVTYTVNTVDADLSPLCSDGRCTCDYGDFVVVESSYPTGVHILLFADSFTLRSENTLHCWRGGAP